MIQTVYSAETFFLVNDAPNFAKGFTSTFALAADLQTSLTKHESRRPYSATVRGALKFSCTVSDEGLRALLANLRALTTQRVVIPFWPAVTTIAGVGAATITGGLYVAWKSDWSQVALFPAGAPPGWALPGDLCAPVLVGFLKNNQPKMLSATAANWSVDFTESSPAAWAISFTNAPAMTAGPQPAGYAAAPKLFPFNHDFKDDAEDILVTVDRKNVGFNREQSVTFYPHDPYRAQTAQYTLQGADISSLLAWFTQSGAPGDSFWSRSGFVSSAMLVTAHVGDTNVQMDTAGLNQGDWLATNANGTWQFFQVNVVVDATHAILTSALTFDVPANWPLFGLALARLSKPNIQVDWRSPSLAKVKMAWQEVRPEAALPADETLGATIGRLAQRVALFHFYRDLRNGTVQHWYFTSYEHDLTYTGQTWSSGAFTCGDITQGLNMEDDVCEVESFIFNGNPLCDEVALSSETQTQVDITFADYLGDVAGVANLDNVTLVFSGFVGEPQRDGNSITARCKLGPSIFETMAPRWVRGVQCNNIGGCNPDGSYLISAGCTLLKANWKFTATVAAALSSAYPFTLNVAGLARAVGAAPTYFQDWFAGGWVEWGAGANLQRRSIIKSTVPAAGAMALTLHRYFCSLPNIGEGLVIYPGCDGLYTTCKAYDAAANPTGKFDNYLNFGGEPFTPASNPSTAGLPQLGVTGTKK